MKKIVNYKALRLLDISNKEVDRLLSIRKELRDINDIKEIDQVINYHLQCQRLIWNYYD